MVLEGRHPARGFIGVASDALDDERASTGERRRDTGRASARERVDDRAVRRHERADQLRHQLHGLRGGMPIPIADARHEEESVVLA
jgi:hypothetical protein